MKDLNKLSERFGNLLTFTTPSGRKVILREQNGADDDVISNASLISKGESIAHFLSGVIVDSEYTEKGKLNPSEIQRLRLADVYSILIQSRIFSLGEIINFQYQWADLEKPVEYEEDLQRLIWDYREDNPIPEEGDKKYCQYRLPKVSPELQRELKLESGKEVVYTYGNLLIEFYLDSLPVEEQSRNQELKARELKLKNQSGEYEVVENFSVFSTRDMLELRKDLDEHDPILTMVSDIEHPKSGLKIAYPVVASLDFFFPRGI